MQLVVPEMEESGAQLLLVLGMGQGGRSMVKLLGPKCEDLSSNPRNPCKTYVYHRASVVSLKPNGRRR